jgi:hypothetical protein
MHAHQCPWSPQRPTPRAAGKYNFNNEQEGEFTDVIDAAIEDEIGTGMSGDMPAVKQGPRAAAQPVQHRQMLL